MSQSYNALDDNPEVPDKDFDTLLDELAKFKIETRYSLHVLMLEIEIYASIKLCYLSHFELIKNCPTSFFLNFGPLFELLCGLKLYTKKSISEWVILDGCGNFRWV